MNKAEAEEARNGFRARQAARCQTILDCIREANAHADKWLDAIQKAQEQKVFTGEAIDLELSRAEHHLMNAQASLSIVAIRTARHMKRMTPQAQEA